MFSDKHSVNRDMTIMMKRYSNIINYCIYTDILNT